MYENYITFSTCRWKTKQEVLKKIIICLVIILLLVESSNNGSSPESENGSTDNQPVEMILANWVDRFVAWLIDFIIVSIGLGILFALLILPFWLFNQGNGMTDLHRNLGSLHYVLSSSIFFAYWTYFEHTSGQSIGKRLLKIKSTDLSGNKIDIKNAALESFGKSFLLPIDVILDGFLLTTRDREYLTN